MVTTPVSNPFKKRDRPHIHESESALKDLPPDALAMIGIARDTLLSIISDTSEYLIETLANKKDVLAGIIGLRMELVNSMVRTFEAEGQYVHLVYTGEGYDAILSNVPVKSLTVDEAIATVRDLVK